MAVKQSVLEFLEANRNEYFSGEQLAGQLGVSRNAVWKAIKKLQEEGYEIEAVTNKGYCLLESTDILSEEGLQAFINPPQLFVYKTIDSTNEEAKRLALSGAVSKTLVVANEQTAGKGRRGRSFYSPADTGIYMSVLLKLNLDFAQSVLVTTAASVAVCRAIEAVCGISCQIKWVNDVFYNGKKICGILTEAVADMETGNIDSLVVGIGLNVKTSDFPEEVKDVATSILDGQQMQKGIRNQLAASVYEELMKVCEELPKKRFLEEYKNRSMVIGKSIRYTSRNEWKNAEVLDIDDEGGLVILSEEEGQMTLNSGEISIRVKE